MITAVKVHLVPELRITQRMAVINNVVTKIYSFVQIVGLSDPVPQFFENSLTQLEGMSRGATVDTLECS